MVTWTKDLRRAPGRTIFDCSDHTSVEIEWWYVEDRTNPSPHQCSAIELHYYGPTHEHSWSEYFYFDQYAICSAIVDELIDCFSDNVRREELLTTLRVKEVL